MEFSNLIQAGKIIEMLFFCGFSFVVFGGIMYFFPPKKRNQWYGYRTAQSLATEENWKFAQRYSAKCMSSMGVLQLIISLLPMAIPLDETNRTLIGIFVLILSLLVLIVWVEKAIRTFEKKIATKHNQK